MSYRVNISSDFSGEAKRIAKKHKSIKTDIAKLIEELELNATKGTPLGQNVFKIWLAISGTNKGKSGGARIITYVVGPRKLFIFLKSTLKVNMVVSTLIR